jgi:hypothetical protein
VKWAAVRLTVAFSICCLAGAAAGAERELIVLLRAAVDVENIAAHYHLTLERTCDVSSLAAGCAVFGLQSAQHAEDVIARLHDDRRVQRAQPVMRHRVAGMPPKDPYFDLQVRTRPSGVTRLLRRGQGAHVRIAIIDTGVDREHPDLLGRIAFMRNFVGGNADTIPAEFHGTAVTGLIAAHAGNGMGIHGLATGAEIYSLRGCWEPSYGYGLCSSETLAQALDYAIEVRARIINLSLAGPEDPLLDELVTRATELGATVFGAIGEDPDLRFPTSNPHVVAVEQAHRPDIAVAGERLSVPGLQLLTTVPGGRYDFVSGPSFATAHASGVAAVMLGLQPHLDNADLADWLRRLHGNALGARATSPLRQPPHVSSEIVEAKSVGGRGDEAGRR